VLLLLPTASAAGYNAFQVACIHHQQKLSQLFAVLSACQWQQAAGVPASLA
jgi:hypothetical protein